MAMLGFKKGIGNVILYGMLVLGVIFFLYPFLFMFLGSFKGNSEIFSVTPTFLPKNGFQFANYHTLFSVSQFSRALLNSAIVSTLYTVCGVAICSMAAFGFAKYKFPGNKALFMIMLSTMMLPLQAKMVPLFIVLTNIGWTNTYTALIVPFLAYPFGIFIMRQFMRTIPNDLLDAGRIDGCGDFRLLWLVAFPVSLPAYTVLGLIMFMSSWNNFLWPLVVISDKNMFTVPLALTRLQGLNRSIQYGPILAGSFLGAIILVVLFLMFQKKFIQGIMAGAIKG